MSFVEVLGGVAAGTQVLEQAVKCSFACVEFYRRCREAPEVAKQQQAKVERLESILRSIQGAKSLQTKDVLASVDGCNIILTNIRCILEEALLQLDDSDTRKFRKRIDGAINDPKMRKCFAQLEEAKSGLSLSIEVSIAQMVSSLGISQSMKDPEVSKTNELHLYEVDARRAPNFVGRKSLLEALQRLLYRIPDETFSGASDPMMTRVVVLRALGGQGKSQVAMEMCRRLCDKDMSAILWVDASSEDSVRNKYSEYAQLIQSQEEKSEDTSFNVSYLMRKLRTSANGFLIVMDNYDWPSKFDNIQRYIPDSSKGSILITSRHADAGVLASNPDLEDIQLQGLECTDAIELLYRLSRLQRTNTNNEHCQNIVERLACHPLAITQAAAVIRRCRVPLAGFISYYECKKAEVLRFISQPSSYTRSSSNNEENTSLSVFTTWELSFQQMTNDVDASSMQLHDGLDGGHRAHDHARRLVSACAFLGQGEISESLFAGYVHDRRWFSSADPALCQWLTHFLDIEGSHWDHNMFGACLASLSELSLIESFTERNGWYTLSLHPLVRDWLRLRYNAQTQQRYAHYALYLVGHNIQQSFDSRASSYKMTESQHHTVMRHIKAISENRKEFGPRSIDRTLTDPSQAVTFQLPARAIQGDADSHGAEISEQQILEVDQPPRCLVVESPASNSSGALEILNDVQADSDCSDIMLMSCASYCIAVGKAELGATFAERLVMDSGALRHAELMDPLQGDKIADALLMTASCAFQGSNSALAEAMLRWLLALYDRFALKRDLRQQLAYIFLGGALTHQSKYPKAIEVLEITVVQGVETYGPEHWTTIYCRGLLASCFVEVNDWSRADGLLQDILPTSLRVLGAQNAVTLSVQSCMVDHLMKSKQNEKGIQLLRDLLQNTRALLGEHNPDTISTMERLQQSLAGSNSLQEADELLKEISKLRKHYEN